MHHGADKQSVKYALRTFSESVETKLRALRHTSSATFCQIVRQWFEAVDQRLSFEERLRRVRRLRDYLYQCFSVEDFMRNGVPSHVLNLPMQTFEALLAHTISFELLPSLLASSDHPDGITILTSSASDY